MRTPKGTTPDVHDRCSGRVREEIYKREDEVAMLPTATCRAPCSTT